MSEKSVNDKTSSEILDAIDFALKKTAVAAAPAHLCRDRMRAQRRQTGAITYSSASSAAASAGCADGRGIPTIDGRPLRRVSLPPTWYRLTRMPRIQRLAGSW